MTRLITFFMTIVFAFQTLFANISIARNDRTDRSAPDPFSGTVRVLAADGWASSVYPLADGTLIAGWESADGIRTAVSADGGETWQNKTLAVSLPGYACANINFYENGETLYLACRATGPTDAGFYTSLRLFQSADGGKSWHFHSVIDENTEPTGVFKGLWEPCLGEIGGKLVCVFANDSTAVTTQQNIESLTWNGRAWTGRNILSNGEKHDSRDGMPVWIPLRGGGFVCVIESTKYRNLGYPFMIQMLFSEDGLTWSEPKDIYVPKTKGSKAAAPWIVQTDDGRLVLSFQTDEDKEEKGDAVSVSKLISARESDFSKLGRGSFSSARKLFPDEYDAFSMWGHLATNGETLYYSAGTPLGAAFVRFRSFPER